MSSRTHRSMCGSASRSMATTSCPLARGRHFVNKGGWVDEIVGGMVVVAHLCGTDRHSVQRFAEHQHRGWRRCTRIRPCAIPSRAAGRRTPRTQALPAPAQVKTKLNYFNPCAFANPVPGEAISDATHPIGSINPDGVPGQHSGSGAGYGDGDQAARRAAEQHLWAGLLSGQYVACSRAFRRGANSISSSVRTVSTY